MLFPKLLRRTTASSFGHDVRRRRAAAAAADGDGARQQQLGHLRRAHRHRPAAARQRPAPRASACRRSGPRCTSPRPDLDVAGVTLPGTPGRDPRAATGASPGAARTCTTTARTSTSRSSIPRDPDHYRTARRLGARADPRASRSACARARSRPSWRDGRSRRCASRATGRWSRSAARQYALRWTALQDDAVELTAFARLQRAANWDEFRAAVRLFPGPVAELRLRGRGRAHRLVLGRPPAHPRARATARGPTPGASADGDWLGFVPFEELPARARPAVRDASSPRTTGWSAPTTRTTSRAAASGPGARPRSSSAWRRARAGRRTTSRACRASGCRSPTATWRAPCWRRRRRHAGDAAWDEVAREMTGWDGRLEPDSRPAALAVLTFRAIGDARDPARACRACPGPTRLARRIAADPRLIRERPASWVPAGRRRLGRRAPRGLAGGARRSSTERLGRGPHALDAGARST